MTIVSPIKQYLNTISDLKNRRGCCKAWQYYDTVFTLGYGAYLGKYSHRTGYQQHLAHMFCAGIKRYEAKTASGSLPFTLDDVLLVIFFHDIEVPFDYPSDKPTHPYVYYGRRHGWEHKVRKISMISKFNGIKLTEEHWKALRYIHTRAYNIYEQSAQTQLGQFCYNLHK